MAGHIEIPVRTPIHRTGYQEGALRTEQGPVAYRRYTAPRSHRGVIWVGGAGGGWDSPARALYPRLGEELALSGIHSLRVRLRNPRDLAEATADVQAGIAFYAVHGVREVGLVGHSFGGAVVIRAAAAQPAVRTVVTLATQTYGTDPVSRLGPGCSILLIHGLADTVLPWQSSKLVFQMARELKRVVYVADAGHGLDESADQVHTVVRDWLIKELPLAASDKRRGREAGSGRGGSARAWRGR